MINKKFISLQISKDLNNNPSMIDRLIFDAKLSLDDNINAATKKAEDCLSVPLKAAPISFLWSLYNPFIVAL